MKKFIAIVLCLAMLVSALALTISATADLIADKLDLTDLSQFGADSTYADDNWWAPIMDGAVTEDEYDTEKVWNDDNRRFANANSISAGKTLTEYVAHDSEYVYIAFVSTENVKEFTFYVNATEAMLTDHDQCGIVSTLFFNLNGQDENDSPVAGSTVHTAVTSTPVETLRAFEEGEYEAIAKRNYNGGVFANVTVEIKMSKAAMEEIFDVDSVEHFGYYVDGAKTSGGHYVNSRKYTGTTSTTKFSGMGQFETLYGVNRGTYYADQGRVLNFVIFDEAPAPVHYCLESCTCEGKTRTTEFSLADITQWSQLPTTYVTVMRGAPAADGFVTVGEYMSEKVWDAQPDRFAGACCISNGKTLTEYASHDDEYAYIAFVSTEDVKQFTFYFNASTAALEGLDFYQGGVNSKLTFKLDGRDVDTAPESGTRVHSTVPAASKISTLRGLADDEYEAYAKRNYNGDEFVNVTVEIKISKAAMGEIFGVDSVEYFGYYVDGAKVSGGNYVNSRKFTGTATYLPYVTIGLGNLLKLYGINDRGAYYTAESRVLNFVIFDEEPTPSYYCQEGDSCTAPNHANRSTEFSMADITQWNQLPSTYLPKTIEELGKKVERPEAGVPTVADGTVNADEYTTSKVWDDNNKRFANANSISAGKTLTEYVAHDDNYVYIAFVSTEDVTRFRFYLNATEAMLTDHDQAGITSILDFDLNGKDVTTTPRTAYDVHSTVTSTPVETLRALEAGEYKAIAKRNYNGDEFANVTVEIKISKAAMEDIFDVDSVEHFGYYVDGTKASGGAYVNSRKYTGTTSTTKFSGMTQFETLYGVNRGTYYASQSRVLNFVIFDEAPDPVHYCLESCTCEGKTRTTEFSLADITQWSQLPSTYVEEEKVAYGANGDIQAAEYRTITKFVNKDANGNPFERAAGSPDFAAGALPTANGYVKEYVSQDDNYIYLGFEMNQDMKEATIFFNGNEAAATDIYEHSNVQAFKYTFAEGSDVAFAVVDSVYDEVDYDGVARKYYNANGDFTKLVVELQIAKAAIKEECGRKNVDFVAYSFFAKSPDKNAYDNVHLCSRITEAEVVANSDFESLDAFLAQYDPYNAYEENGNKLLRFVCFYEEPAEHNVYGVIEPEVEDTTTEPEESSSEPAQSSSEPAQSSSEPAQSSSEPAQSSSEPAQSSSEPAQSSSEPAQSSSEPAQSSSEPAQSSSEPAQSSDEPTTAEPTTAEPTTAEPTTAATTKAATTAATTAAEEKGCGKSIALSALAIVPVLGLGVAVVSKKKED